MRAKLLHSVPDGAEVLRGRPDPARLKGSMLTSRGEPPLNDVGVDRWYVGTLDLGRAMGAEAEKNPRGSSEPITIGRASDVE